MIQVIVTKNVSERAICIEHLEDMGYTGLGYNSDFNTAPAIKAYPEQKQYQTITADSADKELEQITATQFLEITLIK